MEANKLKVKKNTYNTLHFDYVANEIVRLVMDYCDASTHKLRPLYSKTENLFANPICQW
jgi:hypothetical protein